MKVNTYILIVGRGFKSLINYLDNHNLDYIVLQDSRLISSKGPLKPNHILCDFSSKEAILKTADSLNKPSALICTYENYILPAAWLSQHFGLPGLSEEAARACTDKELMREKFAKSPQPISPDFRVVKSKSDLEEFADSHDFPLILKPANLSKSMLVHKCHNIKELMNAYERTIKAMPAIYAKYAPNATPKLLVEEFMSGSIHSVDAFVDANGSVHTLDAVVDYKTGYDVGYDDNFHYSRSLPSKLTPDQQSALRQVAELGCQALGITSSPAHIEIIMTNKGPRIVEIGARNGGYRERMHAAANGIDVTANALALALNHPLDVIAKRHDAMEVLELFPKVSGHFLGLSNEDSLRKLPSLSYLSIKAKAGQFVGSSSAGHKAVAIIFLHHTDAQVVSKDLDYINRHVGVKTDGSISN